MKVSPIHGDYSEGLKQLAEQRPKRANAASVFLGSTIGNFERPNRSNSFEVFERALSPGDLFLTGTDLVKDVERMLNAYDDPTGVTSAFNLNLLGRMNRELDADFDLRSFTHEARWNEKERRIEMHLVSRRSQRVNIAALEARSISNAVNRSGPSHRISSQSTIWNSLPSQRIHATSGLDRFRVAFCRVTLESIKPPPHRRNC